MPRPTRIQRGAWRVRHQLQAYERGADLDYDEQEELAIKVRYGIGRAQLDAIAASALAVLPEYPPIRDRPYPPGPPAGSEAARAAAVHRLGRGHQLGRTWRR
jgi:hypothetical protein